MSVDDLRRRLTPVLAEAQGPVQLVGIEPLGEGRVIVVRGHLPFRQRVALEQRILDVLAEGGADVDIQWLPIEAGPPPDAKERARARLGIPASPSGEVVPRPPPELRRPAAEPKGVTVRGVRRVLAVASGKGGVGKSTVAVNLAIALRHLGLRAGLLDADIYGPSMPTMLGTYRAPRREGEFFVPPEGRSVPFLSLGLMVNPDQSVIWRGPMVQRLVADMMQKTAWPDLDVLVVDLPPGTGDVQLTLCQKTLLDGAVIVTTPQDIALLDAARGLEMFRRLSLPVFGIVENMAGLNCPSCGALSHPFGEGGGEREAARLGVPFLGRVPLDERVRIGGDEGVPIVDAAPDSAASVALIDVARRVLTHWPELQENRPSGQVLAGGGAGAPRL